jgi:hypothetical protein
LVLRNAQYYYHLTGTSFYEPLNFNTADEFKEVWNQEFISENSHVKDLNTWPGMYFQTHKELQQTSRMSWLYSSLLQSISEKAW